MRVGIAAAPCWAPPGRAVRGFGFCQPPPKGRVGLRVGCEEEEWGWGESCCLSPPPGCALLALPRAVTFCLGAGGKGRLPRNSCASGRRCDTAVTARGPTCSANKQPRAAAPKGKRPPRWGNHLPNPATPTSAPPPSPHRCAAAAAATPSIMCAVTWGGAGHTGPSQPPPGGGTGAAGPPCSV